MALTHTADVPGRARLGHHAQGQELSLEQPARPIVFVVPEVREERPLG